MKKVFIIIFIIVCAVATAQTIIFADANFKAKLLQASPSNHMAQICPTANGCSNYVSIDTNNDGEIQQSEASVITGLGISGANITNLSGIRYFTNLKNLTCEGNSISSFNSTGLSNLEFISFYSNQITSFSLAGLPNLKILGLTNNQLTTISFADAPNLKLLDLAGNLLTNLNLSNLPSLELFSCVYNLLTSLDLTGLPNLKALIANNNNLTTLDIRANPLLNDLGCSNNPNLTSLYMKNGINQLTPPNIIYGDNWSNCSNLNYICADTSEISAIQSMLAPNYNMANITIDSACVLGVEGFESSSFMIYPNPVTSHFSINTTVSKVTVYNLKGQLVAQFTGGFESGYNYDIQSLSAGVYVVKIVDNDNNEKNLKLVKE